MKKMILLSLLAVSFGQLYSAADDWKSRLAGFIQYYMPNNTPGDSASPARGVATSPSVPSVLEDLAPGVFPAGSIDGAEDEADVIPAVVTATSGGASSSSARALPERESVSRLRQILKDFLASGDNWSEWVNYFNGQPIGPLPMTMPPIAVGPFASAFEEESDKRDVIQLLFTAVYQLNLRLTALEELVNNSDQ